MVLGDAVFEHLQVDNFAVLGEDRSQVLLEIAAWYLADEKFDGLCGRFGVAVATAAATAATRGGGASISRHTIGRNGRVRALQGDALHPGLHLLHGGRFFLTQQQLASALCAQESTTTRYTSQETSDTLRREGQLN